MGAARKCYIALRFNINHTEQNDIQHKSQTMLADLSEAGHYLQLRVKEKNQACAESG